MKILVLTHEYPPIGGGGGMVAKDLAKGLVRHNHQIHIITTKIDGIEPDEPQPNVAIDRLNTFRKSAYKANFLDMLFYNITAFNRAAKVIRTWKPDVIHAHFAVPAGAVAYLLSIIYKVPYILTVHLGDVPGAVPNKTDQWFQWVYPLTHPIWQKALKIIAVSDFTRQLALMHYNVPIDVIHNGMDMASLPTRKPFSFPPDPVRIIFAARFVEVKNPQHLIKALAPLKGLNWVCNMLGDGPLLEETKALSDQFGLQDQVRFLGWVTPDLVLNDFTENDILVLPSSSEGLSVVGVQALSMGLVMLLSNAGGNPELVWNNENGSLFEVGDVQELTSQLRRYISDRNLLHQTRTKSLEFAQKFDLDRIVDQYEKVFSTLSQ